MKNPKLNNRILKLDIATIILSVVLIVWIDDIVDMPTCLYGALQTHYLEYAYFLEYISTVIVGIIFISCMLILCKHVRRSSEPIRQKGAEINRLQAFVKNAGMNLRGRSLSPGLAEGVAMMYSPSQSESNKGKRTITNQDIDSETGRLDCALLAALCELGITQQPFAGDMVAVDNALLDVQLTMLKDDGFWDKCRQRIQEDFIKAEQAVMEEIEKVVRYLQGLEQSIPREQSAYILTIHYRVLRLIQDL